jgi:hypothetical protein
MGWERHAAVVAPAGFEPAISALRGRCPGPLDDGAGMGRAAKRPWLPDLDSNQDYLIQSQACYRCTIRQDDEGQQRRPHDERKYTRCQPTPPI